MAALPMKEDMHSAVIRLAGLFAFGVISCVRGADAPVVKASEQEKAPVVMEAFKIDGNYVPKLSFGLSLDVWKNNDTQKVISIYVSAVREGSPAEKKGLSARARIYRIDGQSVENFTASFVKGTELNDKFVHRLEGARVVLEVGIPGQSELKVVKLEEERSNSLPGVVERYRN